MTTTMTPLNTAIPARIDPAIARSFLSRCTTRNPLATADPAENRDDLAAVDERGHPSWCTAAGLSDRTTCGGQHISDSTDIPALGGPWTLTDGGGDIARAQVCLTHDADTGRTAIEVMVADSNVSPLQRDWIAASLDPAGAEQLAAALIAYAHQARQPYGSEG